MRTTHTCPKCQHPEVIFFKQIADRDDDDRVRPIVMHVVHFSWRDDIELGQVQAYVCRSCGYTELYTAGASEMKIDKIPGAKILKKGQPPLK
jgi:predicted nucleic-acid-binding Zn-ribbon protein